jgi:hypothetical protein
MATENPGYTRIQGALKSLGVDRRFYRAIGEPESRLGRPSPVAHAAKRVMLLGTTRRISQSEAAVVRRIFEMARDGIGKALIAGP